MRYFIIALVLLSSTCEAQEAERLIRQIRRDMVNIEVQLDFSDDKVDGVKIKKIGVDMVGRMDDLIRSIKEEQGASTSQKNGVPKNKRSQPKNILVPKGTKESPDGSVAAKPKNWSAFENGVRKGGRWGSLSMKRLKGLQVQSESLRRALTVEYQEMLLRYYKGLGLTK